MVYSIRSAPHSPVDEIQPFGVLSSAIQVGATQEVNGFAKFFLGFLARRHGGSSSF
jgi:hypothetical protein